MKKLPRKHNVKGQEYRVVFPETMEEGTQGTCDQRRKVLEVLSTLDPYEKKWTLIHELLHAVFHESCVDISHDTEEVLVENLERWLKDTFYISWK